MIIRIRFGDYFTERTFKNFGFLKFLPNLDKVLYLDCSENQLTSLPEEIGNLVNLRELNCETNKLTSLSLELFAPGNLVNLKELRCGWNELTSLPVSLTNLRNLQYFCTNSNFIEEIPIQAERFLYRIRNRQTSETRVYSDGQNVHNLTINNSVKLSLSNILYQKGIELITVSEMMSLV